MTGETRQIGQYTCYKATMIKIDKEIDWGSIFGRRGRGAKKNDSTKTKQAKPPVKTQLVTAWYTPQIPVSAGPERYWGLPGLILEINAGRTTMLCTEIVIILRVVEIKKPSKGKEVSRDEYDVMMKKKSEELREAISEQKRWRKTILNLRKSKMKIKKILTLVIFMTTLITNAQIKLTGVVKDSIGPLEMANVIALDTVLKRLYPMALQMPMDNTN